MNWRRTWSYSWYRHFRWDERLPMMKLAIGAWLLKGLLILSFHEIIGVQLFFRAGDIKVTTFSYVMVCVGHHVQPHTPALKNIQLFRGQVSHSHDYKVALPYNPSNLQNNESSRENSSRQKKHYFSQCIQTYTFNRCLNPISIASTHLMELVLGWNVSSFRWKNNFKLFIHFWFAWVSSLFPCPF